MATAKRSTAKDADESQELDQQLPPLSDGEMAEIVSIQLLTRETKAPSHYTEGTLIGDMEGASKFVEDDPELKKMLKVVTGLGTAATRDSYIETLKGHGYLEKSGKYIVATEKGLQFIAWLKQVLPESTDVAMTARWEAELAVVAQKGGGSAFEDRIVQKVRDLVSTFKAAPPLALAAKPANKESSMSENSAPQRSGKPTDKMLDFAKSIAKKLNLRVPDEVMSDFDACKAFIDENRDAAMRPSEKQLSFANSIASSKGLTIPDEVLANGRELSKWIDENR